jgi:hypothetical protein
VKGADGGLTPHQRDSSDNLEKNAMPRINTTPNRIRKIPTHRKVKYLMNEEEWARKIHDHYFKQADKAGKTVYLSDLWAFNAVIDKLDINLGEFLGRNWK